MGDDAECCAGGLMLTGSLFRLLGRRMNASLYLQAFEQVENGTRARCAVTTFATFPSSNLSNSGAFEPVSYLMDFWE